MIKDSGMLENFETGAVRDTQVGKPRPDLISPFATERLGAWLALGAQRYDERNWESGMPFSRVLASLERHLTSYKQGCKDEDHLVAIACNAMFLLHYEEGIKRGFLPPGLNDMPVYLPTRQCDNDMSAYLPTRQCGRGGEDIWCERDRRD